jgi:hypothetical protein
VAVSENAAASARMVRRKAGSYRTTVLREDRSEAATIKRPADGKAK